MSQASLRVRAVSGLFPVVTEDGALLRGRFCGRDKAGDVLPDGETVPDNSYYRRGLLDGSLELVAESTG